MLDEFYGQRFPPGAWLSEEEAEELEAISEIAPLATYEAEWRERNNPMLNGFNFLDDLDIDPEDEEGDAMRGAWSSSRGSILEAHTSP